MGTTFCRAKHWKSNGQIDRKAEVMAYIDNTNFKVLQCSLVGSIAYMAVQDNSNGNIFGVVAKTYVDKFDFGIKLMEDNEHPYYYDCPVSILKKLTPTDSNNARQWRDKCWSNYNAKKKKVNFRKLPAGSVIQFKNPFHDHPQYENDCTITLRKVNKQYGSNATWKDDRFFWGNNLIDRAENITVIKTV